MTFVNITFIFKMFNTQSTNVFDVKYFIIIKIKLNNEFFNCLVKY